MSKGLSKFFEPESVAVIGASGTPHKPGNDVIRNILANEYGGKLYLVNPKGGEIHGIKVHRSIQELPKGIDLAIIILPAKGNMLALKNCVDQGIEYFVLAAGGFSEVDEKEKRYRRKSSASSLRPAYVLLGQIPQGIHPHLIILPLAFSPLGKSRRETFHMSTRREISRLTPCDIS